MVMLGHMIVMVGLVGALSGNGRISWGPGEGKESSTDAREGKWTADHISRTSKETLIT